MIFVDDFLYRECIFFSHFSIFTPIIFDLTRNFFTYIYLWLISTFIYLITESDNVRLHQLTKLLQFQLINQFKDLKFKISYTAWYIYEHTWIIKSFRLNNPNPLILHQSRSIFATRKKIFSDLYKANLQINQTKSHHLIWAQLNLHSSAWSSISNN